MNGKSLRIGWASRDVTPDKPVNLSGQFPMRIASTVRDPLTVTALAVSAEGQPVAKAAFIWVACDTVGIPDAVLAASRRKLKRLVKGFPVKNLILSATHTHTAPDAGFGWYPPVPAGVMEPAAYAECFADGIAAAAAESWTRRKPGYMAWGLGQAPIGHGRRALYRDDLSKRPDFEELPGMKTEKHARMYGDTADDQFDRIEGYADHAAHFLFTFDRRRALTGAVINIACTAQETEGMSEISADFWHEARVTLRKQYGAKLFVLPQSSAAGGLSPHPMFNKQALKRRLALKGISSRQDIANRITAAFDDTFAWAAKELKGDVVVKHLVETIALPRRRVTEREYRQAKLGLRALEQIPACQNPDETKRRSQDSFLHSRKQRCRRILARYAEQKLDPNVHMELHVIRMDDIALATNAFELFEDYGIRIQARSPATQTFVVELCGGGRASYLPTRIAQQGESYSACVYCNEVGPEGGDRLVDETVSRLKSLWK